MNEKLPKSALDIEFESIVPKKKKKRGIFSTILMIVLSLVIVTSVAFGVFVTFNYIVGGGVTENYALFDNYLFYTNRNGSMRVNNYSSSKVYFDISSIPESYREQTRLALKQLSTELEIFDIECVEKDVDGDIDFKAYSTAEHEGQKDTAKNENAYIGYCQYSTKGFNFLTGKYDVNEYYIAIDYYQFDEYKDTIGDKSAKEKFFTWIENATAPFSDFASDNGKQINQLRNEIKAKMYSESFSIGDDMVYELYKLIAQNLADGNYLKENEDKVTDFLNAIETFYYYYSEEGFNARYRRTVMHEAMHALLFVRDIANENNPYYESAVSLMTYSPLNRAYEITEFDRKNLVKPAIIYILINNPKLAKELGYDLDDLKSEADIMIANYGN